MSSTSLSPHIPDLDLITYYAENGNSIFSRVSPWTKGCLLFFIVLLVTVSRSLVLLFGLYLIVLLLYLLAGLPAGKLAYLVHPPGPVRPLAGRAHDVERARDPALLVDSRQLHAHP